MRTHGLKETSFRVRYQLTIAEAIFAVRVGYRSTRDNTPNTNALMRERFKPSDAKTRLDDLWYHAMQRAGVV